MQVLALVVRFMKILKASKYKYVLKMSSSSAHNGLAKLWFQSPSCLNIYANSTGFLWSLNFFINLNQGLQFYSHDLKASWNLKHIGDLCRKEARSYSKISIELFIWFPMKAMIRRKKKKAGGWKEIAAVCPYNIISTLPKIDKTPHYTSQHEYKLHRDTEKTFISSEWNFPCKAQGTSLCCLPGFGMNLAHF